MKEFIFQKTVYLCDTNAFGNVYFAKFFEWQGMAREAFFREVMPNPNFLIDTHTHLITVKAAVEYKQEAYLYDDVEIALVVVAVKHASADMVFTYRKQKDKSVLAKGYQTVAFADQKGNFIRIPPEIIEKARPYVDEKKYVISKIFLR
ncbi:MAG: thioesterase family protein [Candidatus Saganbacteria bacterium]|nr:thioesterase family protein [Candidatus Saganbacteria bacterium]